MIDGALESLMNYACVLRNEIPILTRYTDTIPQHDALTGYAAKEPFKTLHQPDALAGYAAQERYNALRARLRIPIDPLDRKMAADYLDGFAQNYDKPFENLRGKLRTAGHTGLAEELNERRERRRKDLARLIEIAKDPNGKTLDWENAARLFDLAIANDAAFIERIFKQTITKDVASLVKQYTTYAIEHNRDLEYKQKEAERRWKEERILADDAQLTDNNIPRVILAASQLAETLPPEVSALGASAVLNWLNEQIGIAPHSDFQALSLESKIETMKNRLDEVLALTKILDARLKPIADDVRRTRVVAEESQTILYDITTQQAAFNRWIKHLRDNTKPDPKDDKLCRPMKIAIAEHWDKYKRGELDTELDQSTYDSLTDRLHKRDYQEYFYACRKMIVYTSSADGRKYALETLCESENDIRKIVESVKVAEKRATDKKNAKVNKKNRQKTDKK